MIAAASGAVRPTHPLGAPPELHTPVAWPHRGKLSLPGDNTRNADL